MRLQRVNELDARPRPRQIDLAPAEGHRRPVGRRLRGPLDQCLEPLHRVAVVGVRLVPLELRELRRMLVGDALVAEVLRELVHPLEASDDQPLEVELVRDPQVEVAVEEVGVRDERLRESTAVAWLEDGRFDFNEALPIQVAPSLRHDSGAQDGQLARVLVHQEVEVSAAIARFDVGDAVEGVGQRTPDLCQHLERIDGERRLTAPRLHRLAGGPHNVAERDVRELDAVSLAEELNAARAVDEIEEGQLAVFPPRHDATREAPLGLALLTRLETLRLGADESDLVPVGEAFCSHGWDSVKRASAALSGCRPSPTGS